MEQLNEKIKDRTIGKFKIISVLKMTGRDQGSTQDLQDIKCGRRDGILSGN